VFGVDPHADPDAIRAAFLSLTKVYHPARFARMSLELQRESNEVFLAIKAALELITKASQMPAVGTGRTNALPRQATPPTAVATPVTRPGSQPIPTITTQIKPARPGAQPARPGTPPTASAQPVSRPGQTPVPTRVAPANQSNQQRGAGPSAAPPVAVKFAGSSRASSQTPAVQFDERGQLATAFELIQKQQWDAAKDALDALIAQAPDTRQYRALVCYAAGRRAQLEKRLDDARVELNQALMIDPDLTLAKSALAELFNRRK